jgi:uncharacterized membrane protein YhhN
MNYVFLAVFAAFSAVHLYASIKCNKPLRAVTKVFLLPPLLGWYLTTAQAPVELAVAAVVTSWLGDVLLIFGSVGFAVGGMSFFLAHLCFAAAYCMHVDFSLVPVWLIVLSAAVYITAVVFVFRGLIGHIKPRPLYVSMISYLIVNGAMNCFALFQLVTLPCLATAVMFLGALNFFVSDSILFYVRFRNGKPFKTHFPVMLTYLSAEFLILLGFILLN